MKRKKLIPIISVVFSFVCAILLFLNWNVESLFQQDEMPVTMSNIKHDAKTEFTGFTAGEDIPRLVSADDFSTMQTKVDYMTAEPIGIVATGVSSLKPWVDHYTTKSYKGRTSTGSRRAEVTQSKFDIWNNYNPYYLLELPDHTYLLAQIPQTAADAIKKGKNITLPIGQKVGITDTAKRYLTPICKEYGVDINGVYYAFNNQWQKEHHSTFLLIRFGISAVLWLALSVGITLLGNKIFLKKEQAKI